MDEAECWPVAPGESGTALTMRMPIICFSIRLKSYFDTGDGRAGQYERGGDPGALVAKFLDERGIVVEKTGPYTCCFSLVLESIKPKQWDYCVVDGI